MLAQSKNEYQGLLWKISGNGLEKPSYLYGTMHVSNRVAFHLGETFFDALESADIIALETNPEYWVEDLTTSKLYHDFFSASYGTSSNRYPLYSSFVPKEPKQKELEYYLSRDQDMLNSLLYRNNTYEQNFEENTYLDLFIFQTGKKKNKKIVALEDYQESFKSVLMANRADPDAVRITDRQAKALLGNFTNWNDLLEDAYRKGNLDLLDTITSSTNPGKYHRKYMLDDRNEIMVNGMDSLMKTGVVFTGVGAAHLPGNHGVINLLRKMGYTVEAEDRNISALSMGKKDEIDEIIYSQPITDFTSDDNFITTKAPGKLVKFISQPYQEYVFADMANGSFYSIRRISTFGLVYGKDESFYMSRLDSLLFENIPGKIIDKKSITVSGFPAMDITNKTRQGDFQHYQIIFTPLEIIIFKVGGHKDFAKSAQPEIFFKNIRLHRQTTSEVYSPRFGGFKVNMPGNLRTELYEAAFYNPNYTFWAQSTDSNKNYYATGLRQYYDFDYLEEDDFELTYMARKIGEEKKLELDTVYLLNNGKRDYSRFQLSNKKNQLLYGEIHLEGPKYIILLTTDKSEEARLKFFESFEFENWNYTNGFEEYQDTVFHITMAAPKDINNYDSFFQSLRRNSYSNKNKENHDYRGSTNIKVITNEPTGEQVKIRFEYMGKYSSAKSLGNFWKYKEEAFKDGSLRILRDTTLYTIERPGYLSQAREYWLTDTNTDRAIRVKHILENDALFSIFAGADNQSSISPFIEKAFASFRPTGDTVIGIPVTNSRADLFFADLESGDSVKVFEAKNSISSVRFRDADAAKIKDVVVNFKYEGFTRTERLELLNQLAWLKDDDNIPFLEQLYYTNIDSSAYQFMILETLADFETQKANKVFLKLILDEPPFTSNEYTYSNLINELDDSLELAPMMFPGLLGLTDFEDYKPHIYGLLSTLVDSGLVKSSHLREKYNTILRFAKVELKKQRARDERINTYNSYSSSKQSDLTLYNKLLIPFAGKKAVKEHYTNVLKLNNKVVLANQLTLIAPHFNVPDTMWNYVSKDPQAHFVAYEYLSSVKKLNLLAAEYLTKESLAKAMTPNYNNNNFDSIHFIRSEEISIKPFPAVAYFFRTKKKDDKLWSLRYVVVEDKPEMSVDYVMAKKGENYNKKLDDIDEIIEDTLKEIEIYQRKRAAYSGRYNNYDYNDDW